MQEVGQLQEARIKKVGVLSVANLCGMVNVIVGFIFGIFFAVSSSMLSTVLGATGFNFGYLSIIIFPIVYGVLGFIGGAIGAFVYNISAKVTKGIKLYSE